MIHGMSYEWEGDPFYFIRKHFCLKCGTLLVKKKREVVVHSESEEAKNYEFWDGDSFMYGKVKFVTYYFECSKCGAVYENRELIDLEKEHKKIQKQHKKSEKQRKKLEQKRK